MVLLIALVVLAPYLVGLMLWSPVSPDRAASFVARHGLASADLDQAQAMLTRRRRRAVVGALLGQSAYAVYGLAHDRAGIGLAALLAGMFLAALTRGWAVAPDGSDHGDHALVPRWLLGVPPLLGIASLIVMAFVVSVGHATGGVFAYGAGALFVATAATLRCLQILVLPADTSPIERAVRAEAIARLTGLTTALVVLLLAGAAGAGAATLRQDRLSQWTGAFAPATVVFTAGGLLFAVVLASAIGNKGRFAAALAALIVLVAAGVATQTYLHNRPPFSAAAAHLRASVRMTDAAHFAADEQALGIRGMQALPSYKDSVEFVGAVTFDRPPGDGTYSVIVVDPNSGQICPALYDGQGSSWDSFLDSVPDRYPWLDAMRQPGASTVVAEGDSTAPIAFTGTFTDPALTSTGDLIVAVVYSGGDDQIYWASRVPITLTA